jgi:hypothetical protein
VNTNPCLSPESGFAAAIEEAGLSFPAAVARIVAAAPARRVPLAAVGEAPAKPRPLTRRVLGGARRGRRGAAA